jgi:outer membrane protein P13
MKKKIFIVLVFILSINIFAKTNVEKQVEKIREEFTKINSEKNYIVETGGHSGNEVIAEYYKKNGELKKVVVYADATLENYAIQYYFKDDEVFLSMNLKMNTK